MGRACFYHHFDYGTLRAQREPSPPNKSPQIPISGNSPNSCGDSRPRLSGGPGVSGRYQNEENTCGPPMTKPQKPALSEVEGKTRDGSCEEIVFWGSWHWAHMFCDGVRVAVVGWSSHFLYAMKLAALSECCIQIGLAPYAEPPCQVVAEAGPSSFHRYLQAVPTPELP